MRHVEEGRRVTLAAPASSGSVLVPRVEFVVAAKATFGGAEPSLASYRWIRYPMDMAACTTTSEVFDGRRQHLVRLRSRPHRVRRTGDGDDR